VHSDSREGIASGVGGASGSSGRSQRNVDVSPAPLGTSEEKKRLRTVQELSGKATGVAFVGVQGDGLIKGGISKYIGFGIPRELFKHLLDWNYETYIKASEALGGDPPSLDYQTLVTPRRPTFEVLEPNADVTVARADAFNAVMDTSLEAMAELRAAAESLDRYGGAATAGDMTWASRQAAALLTYKSRAATATAVASARIDALVDVLRSEGLGDSVVDAQDVSAYQVRLRERGFSAEELTAARAFGLADEEIQVVLNRRIDMEPAPGSVMVSLSELSRALHELADSLGDRVTTVRDPASALASADVEDHGLTRVYAISLSIPVSNPTSARATIDLRIRRLDMPPDWIVNIQPAQVELEPGQDMVGILRLQAGLAAVQGTTSRVAVEGYVGDDLLNGVVIDVVVPKAVTQG
jgi:hypothetical protein